MKVRFMLSLVVILLVGCHYAPAQVETNPQASSIENPSSGEVWWNSPVSEVSNPTNPEEFIWKGSEVSNPTRPDDDFIWVEGKKFHGEISYSDEVRDNPPKSYLPGSVSVVLFLNGNHATLVRAEDGLVLNETCLPAFISVEYIFVDGKLVMGFAKENDNE